ncbi:ComEC/Rec2 family competence protein [Candidatus Clostridium radicumherbarum]|uniref:ComEC/Rec2 family competence protein n=1 Tax=Candidatus Clostridium radicumherbarum TaxID=3381662 RepID=UPI003B587184
MSLLKKFLKPIIIYVFIPFLFISLTIYLISYSAVSKVNPIYKDKLIVHYIDVGQADSILVQVNGKNLLIDAGSIDSKDKLVSYLKKQGVHKLDYVIATHPHEDHIGGMSTVIKKFTIGEFFAPKKLSNTNVFENMITALKDTKIKTAKAGVKINLGANTICEMLAPNNSEYDDINNYSAVIKLTYINNKFLFMGDAQKLSEDEIINSNADISSDVIKIGHHGSSTSSSKEFLDKVKPKIAVISCGRGNQFGHPNKGTISELKNRRSTIYRTDIVGTVILISDGNTIKKQ